jgi:hypothetical protein
LPRLWAHHQLVATATGIIDARVSLHAQQLFCLAANLVEHHASNLLLILADSLYQARCCLRHGGSPLRQLGFAKSRQHVVIGDQTRSAKLIKYYLNFAQFNF